MKLTALCLQTAEALPEVAAAAASSPEKKLIFPPDTSAIKEASLILMRDKSGSKPTLVRVSGCVVVGLSLTDPNYVNEVRITYLPSSSLSVKPLHFENCYPFDLGLRRPLQEEEVTEP